MGHVALYFILWEIFCSACLAPSGTPGGLLALLLRCSFYILPSFPTRSRWRRCCSSGFLRLQLHLISCNLGVRGRRLLQNEIPRRERDKHTNKENTETRSNIFPCFQIFFWSAHEGFPVDELPKITYILETFSVKSAVIKQLFCILWVLLFRVFNFANKLHELSLTLDTFGAL